MTARVPAMATLAPSLSPDVSALLDKALAFAKDERFVNARAMQEAVRAALEPRRRAGIASDTAASHVLGPSPERGFAEARDRRGWAVVAIAVAGLAATGGTAAYRASSRLAMVSRGHAASNSSTPQSVEPRLETAELSAADVAGTRAPPDASPEITPRRPVGSAASAPPAMPPRLATAQSVQPPSARDVATSPSPAASSPPLPWHARDPLGPRR